MSLDDEERPSLDTILRTKKLEKEQLEVRCNILVKGAVSSDSLYLLEKCING
jgi:hypothetical protein